MCAEPTLSSTNSFLSQVRANAQSPVTITLCQRALSTAATPAVGSLLLRDAVWREPMLYALGMGGHDRPLPKMLQSDGMDPRPVPFYFRVIHPYRFLRQMSVLRGSRLAGLADGPGRIHRNWLGRNDSSDRVANAWPRRSDPSKAWKSTNFQNGPMHCGWMRRTLTPSLQFAIIRLLARLYPLGNNHLRKLCVFSQGNRSDGLWWVNAGKTRNTALCG